MEGSFACLLCKHECQVSAVFSVQLRLPSRIVGWCCCWAFHQQLPHRNLYILVVLSYSTLSTHSAMDAFAQTLMKDAVNCDKHSDLQNSVNQLDFEYGLCCKGFLCKHTCSIYLVLCTVLWLCWVHIKGVLSWYALQGPSLKVCDSSSAFRVGWVIVHCFVVQQLWCRWKDSLNLSI